MVIVNFAAVKLFMKIGIDAGGTKTIGILYKENQAIDSIKGEMGNPIVNFDSAVNNVVQVIENLLLKNKVLKELK